MTDCQGLFEASTLETSANGQKFLEGSSRLKRLTAFLVRILVSLCVSILVFTTTSAAQEAPDELTEIYLPLVMESASVNTVLVVHNLEADEATVTLTAHGATGNASNELVGTVAGNDSAIYSLLTIVPSGFEGAVSISSSRAIAAVATITLSDGTDYASYPSQDQSIGILQLPLLANGATGISTVVGVYNPGTAAAHVSVNYSDSTSAKAILPAKGFHLFDQVGESHTQATFSGTVSSAGVKQSGGAPVVAAVMVRDRGALGAYTAFASGSTDPVFPLVMANLFGVSTGIQLQNVGASSTDVTLSYVNAIGRGGQDCTETRTIEAGASRTFAFFAFRNGDSSDCSSGQEFQGAARVVSNSASEPLVGLATLGLPDQSLGTYAASDPAETTDRLLMPLMMHDHLGNSTAASIVNLGFATTVHCTFSGSAYRSSTTLLEGESFVEMGPREEGYQGSATCDAADGASITAVAQTFSLSRRHLYGSFSPPPAGTATSPPVSSGGPVGAYR